MQSKSSPVSLFEIYSCFFWIGLLSFGGGLMPWIQREVVTRRNWLSNEEFLPGMAMSQVLPGVNSTNVAVYVGQHLRGAIGSAIALSGILTGPIVMVVFAAFSYQYVLGVPAIQAAAAGVAAAAMGMMLCTAISAVQACGLKLAPICVMIATFIMIGILHMSLITVVAIMTPISVFLSWPKSTQEHSTQVHSTQVHKADSDA